MKKRFFGALLSALLLFSILLPGAAAWADGENSAVTGAKSSVVRILTEYNDGSYTTGSAFGVGKAGNAPEYFITNAHNCLEADGNPVREIYILLNSEAVSISLDSDGVPIADIDMSRVVTCEVVNGESISLDPDVAVLRAANPVSDRSCIKLRETSKGLAEKQSVYALGYSGDPESLGLSQSSGNQSILAGIDDVKTNGGKVSSIKEGDSGEHAGKTDLVAHSAVIDNGNTGGPLVDETGAAVGVNTNAVNGETGVNANEYCSVFIDYAVAILKEHEIEFDTVRSAGVQLNTKSIVLLSAIILIIVAATLLILYFKKLGRDYLEEQAKKEARQLRLQGMSGVFAGHRFPIDTQVTIGRAPSNNIVYPTGTEGVSANHCVVINSSNQIYVKDTGSTYGTYLNGDSRLPPNQLVTVQVGDKISLGSAAETFIITRKGGKL